MATSPGQSAPEQAKEKVQEVASGASEQARTRVADVVTQRSTDAGQQVDKTAQALRKSSAELSGPPAKALDTVAGRVEDLGTYLRDADGDQILHDIENLARRQPNAVIFGGLTLGFIASRLLKASSTKRYQSSSVGNGTYGTTGYGRQAGLPRAGTAAGTYSGGTPGSGSAGDTGTGSAAGAGVGALSGSPTSGLTAEGDATSAPTSRMGLGNVGGEGEGFIPPRGA
ncbi:MAG: hypothetical protein AVDCRST_MAG65-831 [uncultured Solirubrobacteraceae bacterium]|uniref:DUF3618 domain-containing protein n=1 Tax=uncultured Solirubrobacteraceae bacterium TaxID=1162706 RepID=A0A6J4RIG9_9ACTN|nr:MAG: hypothetical protein AVDCRST_MAG65-831 [uncultured Solirubrobacteraceae bacterium]